MSVHQGGWSELNDNGNSGGSCIVSVYPTAVYWGRLDRDEDYFYINGSNDICTIEVSQNGHEFVEFETNLNNFALTAIPYDETYAGFDIISNSKYLSFVMNNPDPVNPHYSIAVLIVDEDLDGTYNTYQLDANDTIEIVGDPGQNGYYRVRLRIDFDANNSSSDISGSLTVTGWSGSGSSKTLEVKLKHLRKVVRN